MIILALSICSLFKFELLTSIIFTVIFSLFGYAAVIYFKLKFEFDREECRYIRRVLSRIISVKNKVKKSLSNQTAQFFRNLGREI